tara:strand:+ start:372 stop:575 length:204 start_codon:yes stop_codon:yes gene_type:complete
MANSERIHIDIATVGAAPSKKAMKAGPGMGKSKANKGSKLKSKIVRSKGKNKKPPGVKPNPGKGGKG